MNLSSDDIPHNDRTTDDALQHDSRHPIRERRWKHSIVGMSLLTAISIAVALSLVMRMQDRLWSLDSILPRRLGNPQKQCPFQPTLHYLGEHSHSIINRHKKFQFEHRHFRFPVRPNKRGDKYETLENGNFALWSISFSGDVMMSAYNDDKVLDKEIPGKNVRWTYIPPSSSMEEIEQTKTLEGDYVAFIGPYPGVFAHFFLDVLPFIAYLRSEFPPSTKFIIADAHHGGVNNRMRLKELDPKFERERIKWIHCFPRSGKYDCNTMYQIKNGSLTVISDNLAVRNMYFLQLARSWMFQTHPLTTSESNDKVVIYYSRNSGNAINSRRMEPQHEEQILDRIRLAMTRHSRDERLVVFTGDEPGLLNQMQLFRSATTVIGPHGGGLANLIWTGEQVAENECQNKPMMLEFISGPYTQDVFSGLAFGKTYHILYMMCPWLEYHHVLFQRSSTKDWLLIDLDDLDMALDGMWGAGH